MQYNPQLFAMLAEQLLTDSGARLLYGSYAVGVSKTGRRIDAVVIENKSGRQAIAARTVVDATGDADIAHFADAPTATFGQGNVLAAWYYSLGQAGYQLNSLGCADIPEEQKTADYKLNTLTPNRFTGLDGQELSDMVRLSHAAILRDITKRRQQDGALVPVTIPTIPQVRMTRRLVGEYTLHDTAVHTHFADSIGMVSDWRRRGPVYEVPFSTLYSPQVANLITAGRCTSVTDSMWDIMRVIPCCAVTGQAAGTAAAMGTDFAALDVAALQRRLVEGSVVLHEQDIP